MSRSVYSLFLILFIFVFGTSCFENDNLSGSDNAPPQIPEQVLFVGPSSQNLPDDLKNSIDAFNGYMSLGYTYLSIATISKPEVDGTQYTWQVSVGGFTGIIVADKKEDDQVDWIVTISGSDGDVTYTNWVAMTGTSSADGKNGTWNVFAENSTDQEATFTWDVDENQNKTGTLNILSQGFVYEVKNNADKSGSFIKKEGGVKVYEANWDSDGSGEWTRWDSQQQVIDSGNWT